jgi:hypothetical protein
MLNTYLFTTLGGENCYFRSFIYMYICILYMFVCVMGSVYLQNAHTLKSLFVKGN